MSTTFWVEWGALIFGGVLPIPIIWRYRSNGLATSIVLVWAVLAFVGPLASALDSRREPVTRDVLFLVFGWIAALLYCVPLHVLIATIRPRTA